MKAIFLTLLIVCFSTNLFACEQAEITFPKNNLCAKINWITGPSINQFNNATVTIKNNSYSLKVLPWMVMSGGHEHGSRPVVVTTVSPEEFVIEKIYFMGGMSGQWFLRLQLISNTNEIIEEARTLVEL